jgi:hypothetical protein
MVSVLTLRTWPDLITPEDKYSYHLLCIGYSTRHLTQTIYFDSQIHFTDEEPGAQKGYATCL